MTVHGSSGPALKLQVFIPTFTLSVDLDLLLLGIKERTKPSERLNDQFFKIKVLLKKVTSELFKKKERENIC